ncbi:hypothetical protein OENI_10268 [Oenococcus oeni]|nr:hypothetical protein OENI_10268 [Oenococcus oeni]
MANKIKAAEYLSTSFPNDRAVKKVMIPVVETDKPIDNPPVFLLISYTKNAI